MSNPTAPAWQALPTNRSHSFVNHPGLRHRRFSDAARGSSTPQQGRAAKSGKKQQDCHAGDKTCFYFTPDSSGSFSCAEIRAVSTSLHFPSHHSAAHQHKPLSLECMSPSWTKVQQEITAQGGESPVKVWEVKSESSITLRRAWVVRLGGECSGMRRNATVPL